jgi:uncharacterized protein (TIGR03000 family)
MIAAVVVGLSSTLNGAVHGGGGHGGGGGHALAGGGFHGCYGGGYGFRGGYGWGGYGWGYPGWYPFGLGLGLGVGLGYGAGYGYGYPYYPYAAGYPVYVSPGYGPPPPTTPQVCPVAGQAPAPGGASGQVVGGPVRLTDMDVLLTIRVPPEATVRINGEQTNQNGPRREFMSSGLSPGRTYTFVVTARWADPTGNSVEREQRLQVQGGERRNVDFLTPPLPPREFPGSQ